MRFPTRKPKPDFILDDSVCSALSLVLFMTLIAN